MTNKTIFSDSFAVEDIRKVREHFVMRHTDKNGHFDWDVATTETEEGAARVLTEISRIRAERNIDIK